MRSRTGRPGSATVTAIAGAALTVALTGAMTGCSSAAHSPRAQASSSASDADPADADPTPIDPVTACVTKIDYWITGYFLKGVPDRGDYQEMGLGSAEGLALRTLENALAAKHQNTTATAPSDLKQQEHASCTTSGAGVPDNPSSPPVWP